MDTDNILSNKILNKISTYAKENENQEICGVLVKIDDSFEFIKCENLAKNKKVYFEIDPCVFVDYNIQVIVHSHCMGSAKPSTDDKKCSDSIDMPFLIYSVLHDNFCLYDNKSVTQFKV
jgi:proteasome lid subunit RPN8/RPN11